MMSTATVSTKGQVVIPVEIRRALGLEPGDVVAVDLVAPGEARLRRRESLDELAARFTAWVTPGTALLESASDLYAAREPSRP